MYDACGLSQQRPFLKVASSLVFQKRMEEALQVLVEARAAASS